MCKPQVVIVDLGSGNLFSVRQAFRVHGVDVKVSSNPADASGAQAIVLPGVGSFGTMASKIRETGWQDCIQNWHANGNPLMGICLGMQFMFSQSCEGGNNEGLGIFSNPVVDMRPDLSNATKTPVIGWHELEVNPNANHVSSLNEILEHQYMYFVHRFAVKSSEDEKEIAYVRYEGKKYVAAAIKEACWAFQFHPEKSATQGVKTIGSFVKKYLVA